MPEAIAQGITTDDAEKVALVTENRHIQVCFHWPMNGKAYVVLHNSPSAAAICQVEVLSFTCDSTPADKIAELNKTQVPCW